MLQKNNSLRNLVTLLFLGVLVSLVTVVFGTPFFRAIRNHYGRAIYWSILVLIVALSLATKVYFLGILLGSIWFVIGFNYELEIAGVRFFRNLFLSTFLGVALVLNNIWMLVYSEGINNWGRFKEYYSEAVSQLVKVNSENNIDVQILMEQTPSIIAIMLIVAIFWGLLMERKIYFWLSIPKMKSSNNVNFLEFRMSDGFIWLALVTLLSNVISPKGLEGEQENQLVYLNWVRILSSNLLNIFVVLFYFQGVSVFETFLNKIKAKMFFRVFSYLVFLVQLFVFVSFIGFIDYWVDFRLRMSKSNWLKNDII